MTESRHGRMFWVVGAIGWAVMAFGLFGAINEQRTVPTELAAWILGMALAHDLVLTPVVLAAAIAMRRGLPPRIRAMVQGALLATALLVIYSLPLLLGYGRRATNPTIQPNNYALGFAVVAGIVWIAAATVLIRAWRTSR